MTETNLETGRLASEKQLTDRGLPTSFGSRLTLVVPSDLLKAATIITQSDLRSNVANNDLNFYKGIILDVLTSKWLNATGSNGSATAWFLIGSQNRLKLHVTEDVKSSNFTENGTHNEIFDVMTRLSAGHSDWRDTWASLGDGQAYTT